MQPVPSILRHLPPDIRLRLLYGYTRPPRGSVRHLSGANRLHQNRRLPVQFPHGQVSIHGHVLDNVAAARQGDQGGETDQHADGNGRSAASDGHRGDR